MEFLTLLSHTIKNSRLKTVGFSNSTKEVGRQMPFCLIWLCFKPLLKSIPQTDHYSFSEKPDRKALAEEALSVLAAAKQFTAVLIYGPMSNGPEGRFLFHYAENRFCSSSILRICFGKSEKHITHTKKRRGFHEERSWSAGRKEDPGTPEALLVSGRRRRR